MSTLRGPDSAFQSVESLLSERDCAEFPQPAVSPLIPRNHTVAQERDEMNSEIVPQLTYTYDLQQTLPFHGVRYLYSSSGGIRINDSRILVTSSHPSRRSRVLLRRPSLSSCSTQMGPGRGGGGGEGRLKRARVRSFTQ